MSLNDPRSAAHDREQGEAEDLVRAAQQEGIVDDDPREALPPERQKGVLRADAADETGESRG
jgi:hypothetical protein